MRNQDLTIFFTIIKKKRQNSERLINVETCEKSNPIYMYIEHRSHGRNTCCGNHLSEMGGAYPARDGPIPAIEVTKEKPAPQS